MLIHTHTHTNTNTELQYVRIFWLVVGSLGDCIKCSGSSSGDGGVGQKWLYAICLHLIRPPLTLPHSPPISPNSLALCLSFTLSMRACCKNQQKYVKREKERQRELARSRN